jgi:hypothetical protein
LRSMGAALKLEGERGSTFHTPIPIKRTRTQDWLEGSVSPEGQPLWKNLGEDERKLTKEGSTKSPSKIEFSMEENSNRHKGRPRTESSLREREIDWKICLGYRGSQVSLEDKHNRSGQYEKMV